MEDCQDKLKKRNMLQYVFICLSVCSQDKIKTLEIELDEERSSVELLNDRITRSRDQVPHKNI